MPKLNEMETIKVWERGQITLPKNLREEMAIKENDILYIEKIGQGIFLRPKESAIGEIQKKMAAMMRRKGLTIKDLINEDVDEED